MLQWATTNRRHDMLGYFRRYARAKLIDAEFACHWSAPVWRSIYETLRELSGHR